MSLIKRILLGWRLTLPVGGRRIAIPIVLTSLLLCCCGPFGVAMLDASIRQAGLAPTYTPAPTRTVRPNATSRPTRTPALIETAQSADTAPAVRAVQVPIPTNPQAAAIATLPLTPEPPTATPWPTDTPVPPTNTPRQPPATATPAGPTATRNGNLRAGPGTNYPTIGSVSPGQALAVTGRNPAGDWYQLVDGAWISGTLVNGAPAAIPIAANIPPPPAPTAAPVRSVPIAVPTARPLPYAGGSDCDCSANIYNCADFAYSSWDAQSCYMRCLELTGRDVHQLDGDDDGSACEWSY